MHSRGSKQASYRPSSSGYQPSLSSSSARVLLSHWVGPTLDPIANGSSGWMCAPTTRGLRNAHGAKLYRCQSAVFMCKYVSRQVLTILIQ